MKFLILGCQRSGTTLLGMLLQAHPNIIIVEENDAQYHQPYALTKRLRLDAVIHQKPNHTNQVIGFKTPRDTHRLPEFFKTLPGIRVIWIRRDVFPVVASMLTRRASPTHAIWAIKHAPNEIIKYLYAHDDPEIAREFDRAHRDAARRRQAIAFATLCWIIKQRSLGLAGVRDPKTLHQVTYERLVTHRKETTRGLIEFLGLPWQNAVLEHEQHLPREDRPGGNSTTRAIDAASLNKWRSVLTDADLAQVDELMDRLDGRQGARN